MNRQKIKKTLTTIVALLAALAAGCAGFRFGPKPVEADLTQAGPSSPASQPESITQPQNMISNPYQALLGISQDAMQVGESALPEEQYVKYLEKLYERRGYHRGQGSGPKNETHQPTNKIYWREDAGSLTTVCAVGTDSDPNSNDKTARPEIHSTLVSSDGQGGTRWLTLRYRADASTLKSLQDIGSSSADLPGEDPAAVTRPAGLRRLFSVTGPGGPSGAIAVYTTSENPASLVEWYVKTMSRDWQIDPLTTAEAKNLADGLMCFRRGDRYCLVWVGPASATGQTFVIVSSNS